MEQLKSVLIYLSYSMKPFLKHMVINILLFFMVITLSTTAFFIGNEIFKNQFFFFAVMGLSVLFAWLIRFHLSIKKQLIINLDYSSFLIKSEKKIKKSPSGEKPNDFARDTKDFITNLKTQSVKHWSGYFPRKLLVVLTAYKVTGIEFTKEKELNSNTIRMLKKINLKNTFLEWGCIFLLLIPFMGFSLLVTMRFSGEIKLFITILGLLFVWFIHSIVIYPMVTLTMQKKINNLLEKEN